jgi:hypothetical protein
VVPSVRPLLLDLFCGAGGAAVTTRFWRYVDKGAPDECWEWTGSLRNGYGQLNVQRYPFKAHRLSFFIANGWEPPAVCHACDNPPCVNPDHLFGGTQAQNMADAAPKGRARNGTLPGQLNHQAKLTDELVREARRLNAAGVSLHQLARRYAVDRKTITQAIRGGSWSHVV